MTSSTVHVENISSQTTESELNSFFSFCGKITSLSLTPTSDQPNAPKSATITFERDTAAKTAALLNGTPLHNSPLSIETAHSLDDIAGGHVSTSGAVGPDGEIPQEDKPRSAIFAEYLSHGYVIGDQVLQRGIEFDKKQGLTARFTGYLNNILTTLEAKTHATDRARTMDAQYHITDKAMGARSAVSTYFEKALGTPTGQKVRKFYEDSEKQVFEVHQEAKRLAELRKEKKRQSQTFGKSADGKPFVGEEGAICECAGKAEGCRCPDGKCRCAGCSRSGPVHESAEKGGPGGQFQHAMKDIKDTAADVTSEKA